MATETAQPAPIEEVKKSPVALILGVIVAMSVLTALTVAVARHFSESGGLGGAGSSAGQSVKALHEVRHGVNDYWKKYGRMPHNMPVAQLGVDMGVINNLDDIRYVSLSGSASDSYSTTIKTAIKRTVNNPSAGHTVYMQVTAEDGKSKAPSYHCYVRGPNNQAPRISLDVFPPACRNTHAEIPHLKGGEKRPSWSDAFHK